MANLAEDIRLVVEQALPSPEIAALLGGAGTGMEPGPTVAHGSMGIFSDLDAAIAAAAIAQRELIGLPMDTRKSIIQAMRGVVLENNKSLCADAVEETGLGNLADKQTKTALAANKTPGVEDIVPMASMDELGLTLTCNAIGMIAGGNSVVFNVHPGAKRVSCRLVGLLNAAIMASGGPQNLLCAMRDPTIESASILMKHSEIALLVVTGGLGVVKAAMASGKKTICAGPGNPPCVVDATADIAKAGKDIVAGASFDNNVVCMCEKEVLAVAAIADILKGEMCRNGAFELTGSQIEAVTKLVIATPGGPDWEGAPNKAWVGKSPCDMARASPGADVGCRRRHRFRGEGRAWLPAFRHGPFAEYRYLVPDVQNHELLGVREERSPATPASDRAEPDTHPSRSRALQAKAIASPRTFTRERRCTLVGAFGIV